MPTLHPIDETFKQHLGNYQVMPNSAVWERIEQQMAVQQKKGIVLMPKFWMMAAGLLLVIGLGLGLWLISPTNETIAYELISNNTTIDKGTNAPNNNSAPATKINNNYNTKEIKSTEVNEINNVVSQLNNQPSTVIDNSQKRQLMTKLSIKEAFLTLSVANSKTSLSHPVQIAKSSNIPLPVLAMNTPTTAKTSGPNNLSIGAVVAPSHSFRTVNGGSSSAMLNNEAGISSLNGGLMVKLARHSKWMFESGIIYARAGQSVSNSTKNALSVAPVENKVFATTARNETMLNQNTLGRISNNSEKELSQSDMIFASSNNNQSNLYDLNTDEIKQLLDFIEIPLAARYYLTDNKSGRISITAGLSANLLVGNKAIQMSDGANIGKTDNINDVSYSSHVGLGIDVPITSGLTMTIEPIFKYFITPVNHSSAYDFRPYTLGMNTGISYKF